MISNKLKFKLFLTVVLSMWLAILAGAGLALADVVHFKQLMPLVDLKLSGWTVDAKPSGSTMKHGGTSMSQVQATYRSGDQTLEIVVMDFLGQVIPFLGAVQMDMETSEETIRTTTIQGFKAMETFRPQEHHGELSISVADRFWVKIDGNGIENLEVLRNVAQQMDLAKLAQLAK
jgi:hypothetical protein